MGRKEKGEEREERNKGKDGLLMERKWMRGVLLGKRGGNCATPPPKWRLEDNNNNRNNSNKPFEEFLSCDTSPTISARKLCASLWDIESHKNPVAKMVKPSQRTRRRFQKSNKFCGDSNDQDEPASASRRAGLSSLVQHRRSVEKNNDRAIQSVSRSIYGNSSPKVAPYRHSLATPSSLDLKLNLKTSTELIKVLNRIRSIEEENESNFSSLRALETELHRSRARVEKLLIEKESDRQEIDELTKLATGRKSIEQDRIKATVQSVRNELEAERKLRKRSESLEISELKSSFANALRELERERKARVLLENLCDEFAEGISDYEREAHAIAMKHKASAVDHRPDRLILHISEAWLDERAQTKLTEAESSVAEKTTIVDKLGFDIATFLRAKKSISRRYSLESFPLNEAASAPRIPAEEEEDDASDCDPGSLNKRDFRRGSFGKSSSVSCKGNKRESLEAISKSIGSGDKNLARNGSVRSESFVGEESCCVKSLLGNSPVQPWNSKLMTPDFEKSESSLRWPRDLDENTLMTQLIEARLERRRRRSSHP